MPNSPTARRHSTTSKVLKALGVFGGVQAVQMLCSVVRTKLSGAVDRPGGSGFDYTLQRHRRPHLHHIAAQPAPGGAVRDVTMAAETAVDTAGHNRALDTVTAAVRCVAIVLGTLGMIFVFLASPLLGHLTFGDGSHTTAFMVLSPMYASAVGHCVGRMGRDAGHEPPQSAGQEHHVGIAHRHRRGNTPLLLPAHTRHSACAHNFRRMQLPLCPCVRRTHATRGP